MPTIRPQQYRLGWPLTAPQVEHIDTMFETLFRAVRRLTSGDSTESVTETAGLAALGMAGTAWADLPEIDITTIPIGAGGSSSGGLTAPQVAARVTLRF